MNIRLTTYRITIFLFKSINHIYYHQLCTANILNILKMYEEFVKKMIICSLYIYYIKCGLSRGPGRETSVYERYHLFAA